MEKSESIKNIAGALVKFQGLVGKIPKDSKNPFFKSSYASLPDILTVICQPLIDCALTISQFPSGQHELTTIVIHADSGEYMMDTYSMKPSKDDPQGLGSSITYQRRYAIGAILSLNIDNDDDGNAASNNGKTVPEPTTQEKVNSMLKNPPPVDVADTPLTEAHKKAIKMAQGIPALNSIWNDPLNVGLKANEDFIELIKQRRAELTAK